MIYSFEGKTPQLAEDTFVAPDAVVLGEVALHRQASVWYGVVIRGDVHSIFIGEQTNVQDRSVIHVTNDMDPTWIGDRVTIGHGAIVHGCRVGSETLVGMGAVLLDGVEVGEGSVIAAGSLLPPGRVYPPRSLILGSPAQVKREVTEEERRWILRSAELYVKLAQRHQFAHKNLVTG